MPATINARFLSNLQEVRSITGQGEPARRYLETRSLSGVDGSKHTAILGRSSLNKPGILGWICDGQAREFDVISPESLDRLSRSRANVAPRIGARADGAISQIRVDLKAALSALWLKDLAQNTRCGQNGRMNAGRILGGTRYGHHAAYDGDDRVCRTIDPAEADILQRIWREYARKELLAIATSQHSNALALVGSPKHRSGTVDKSSTSAGSSTTASISLRARTRFYAAPAIPRDGSQALCTKVWARLGRSYRRERLAATAWATQDKRSNAMGSKPVLVG